MIEQNFVQILAAVGVLNELASLRTKEPRQISGEDAPWLVGVSREDER